MGLPAVPRPEQKGQLTRPMQGLGIATSARGESRTQKALLPGNRQPLDFQPGGQWCVLSGAHSDDVYTVAVSRLCLARSLNGKKKKLL